MGSLLPRKLGHLSLLGPRADVPPSARAQSAGHTQPQVSWKRGRARKRESGLVVTTWGPQLLRGHVLQSPKVRTKAPESSGAQASFWLYCFYCTVYGFLQISLSRGQGAFHESVPKMTHLL